jgi:putative transposase
MPSPANPHRKRVRHYDLPGHCHELTFSCYRRLPLLADDGRLQELARAIDRAGERWNWRLAAFVFMPEHVHLAIWPGPAAGRIDQLLFAIKRPFSYRARQNLEASDRSLLEQLTVRQRPNVSTFRFWQEGPGYDRNLTTEQAIAAAISYLHLNPVRRGLCRQAIDWPWSSARWYASEGRTIDAAWPRLTPLPAGFFHEGTRGVVPT